MNERQHIALTEAQIIAAEKGEIQLEARDGRKVVQFVWFREPCKQTDSNVLYAVLEDGEICFYSISGKRRGFDASTIDLFVSEPEVIEPKPAKRWIPVGERLPCDTLPIDTNEWTGRKETPFVLARIEDELVIAQMAKCKDDNHYKWVIGYKIIGRKITEWREI